MSKEAGPGDGHAQENIRSLPDTRMQSDRRPDTGLRAGVSLEELNSQEMEVMRRQLRVITNRLQDLEDWGYTHYCREAAFFTILVSASLVNLWLWLRR